MTSFSSGIRGPESTFVTPRAVTGFAVGLAALLALAPPLTWHLAGRATLNAELDASALVKAAVVSDRIAQNPDLWRFESDRLEGVLRLGDAAAPEWRRVVAADGSVVADAPAPLPSWAPQVAARRPLFDAGRTVGWIEARQSLMPLVHQTALVALASLILAAGAFIGLRAGPRHLLLAAMARASYLASHDALTGLPNRVLFHDRLQQAVAQARRSGNAVGVLCLDLDHFKDVNDTLGHAAGDQLLQQVATRLRAAVREGDTVARLGGDEFAVLQIGGGQPSDAEVLARRLVEVMAEPFNLDGHRAVVAASVGIGLALGEAAGNPSRLLREADLALYQAKADGRGAYAFFEAEMNERLLERKRLEQDVHEALEAGHFRLHYQPLVEIAPETGQPRVVGAEALIRWRHPSRGEVRPDQFIPLAEATGLIVPIGEWALREACRRAAGWPEGVRVAVNVSPVQFRHPRFIETVTAALHDSGLAPARLELEVTEGILLTDTEETLATLARLRALGVGLAMDDFGTGYSSLGYLRRFRFDKIKIDGSFVRHLGEDAGADAIVRAVVGMGQAMGVRVNAEGVESEEQVALLRVEGCVEMQGYLFGRPMPPEELEAVLEAAQAVLLPTKVASDCRTGV